MCYQRLRLRLRVETNAAASAKAREGRQGFASSFELVEEMPANTQLPLSDSPPQCGRITAKDLGCADEEDDEATLPLKPLSKSAATAAKAAAANKAAALPKKAAKEKLFKACLT